MGAERGRNSKSVTKGMVATMPVRRRIAMRSRIDQEPANAMATLQALADVYEQIADRLLEQMRIHAADRLSTRTLGRHLDWVGTRAQMVDRFIKAGDSAMNYLCAAQDGPTRLLPLAQLTARNAAEPHGLPVALFLLEKIDEELRLA